MQFVAPFVLDVASSKVSFVVAVVAGRGSFPCVSAFCCSVVVGFEIFWKDFQKCGKGAVGNTDGLFVGRRQWSAAVEHAARLRRADDCRWKPWGTSRMNQNQH